MINRTIFAIILCLGITACVGVDISPTATEQPLSIPTRIYNSRDLKVAYIGNGDVSVWSETNTVALTSTKDIAEVRISQDGQWVAYLQGGQLWLDHSDDNVNNRTSPDYPKLLVSHDFLFNLTTPNPIGGDAKIVRFDFAPNNRDLYFAAFVGGDNGGLDLFRIKIGMFLPVRIVNPGLGGNYFISPDSRCLTISRPNQLDVWCENDREPRRIYEFANECGFGAHDGPDVEWTGDSKGFFVVVPVCDDGILHGRQRLEYVPLNGNVPQTQVEFIGWTYDHVDIAPDGHRLASLVDYGDLKSLHIVEIGGVDNVYISHPRDDIAFWGWTPDSRHFVMWLMNSNLSENFTGPFYSIQETMPIPLLSEDLVASKRIYKTSKVQWLNNDNILFIRNGLWREELGGSMTGIETRPDVIVTSYDFAPKPLP
jgi:dipeptidyl aminopeptidase/acylaminoacyl peptidase